MRVISGTAKGTILKTPEGMDTRPTADRVKEALFSAIQFDIPGRTVLDLFGGTGQLSIEALSRGAKFATIVDAGKSACEVIRENVKRTHFENMAEVVRSDYLQFLKNCGKKYDLIFLDPPYAEVFLENALKCISEIDILRTGGIIVTERPVGKELSEVFPGLIRSRDYHYGKTVVAFYRREQG